MNVKINKNSGQMRADLINLLEESIYLKENVPPKSNSRCQERYAKGERLLREARKNNHFGISKEELECDEEQPIIGWKVRANAFEGEYDSAGPFKEAIWQKQIVDLELQLEAQTRRLQQIRLQCSAEFDAKLNTYLKNRPAKRLISSRDAMVTPKMQEQSTFSIPNTSASTATKSTSGDVSSGTVAFSDRTFGFSSCQIPQTSTTFSSGPSCSSSLIPCTAYMGAQSFTNIEAAPVQAHLSEFESPRVHFTLKDINSLPVCGAEQPGSSRFDARNTCLKTRGGGKEQDSELYLVEETERSGRGFMQTDFAAPSDTSSVTMNENALFSPLKSGHPTLMRTDPKSKQPIFNSLGGTQTNFIVSKVSEDRDAARNEEQKSALTVKNDRQGMRKEVAETASASEIVNDESPNAEHLRITLKRPAIISGWIEFKEKFDADIKKFGAASLSGIRADLKYTINEKTAIWTKKYAKEDEIKKAIRFFTDLLSGVTVFGFRDKRINLKGEDEARKWAIAHIINAYINLLVQDVSLVDVVAAVLSRVASQWEEFTLFLFGKLCASSLLLSMDFHKCREKIVEMSKRCEDASEVIAAWGARENALVRLFAAIHAAWPTNEHDHHHILQECPSTGAPLLWLVTVVALKQQSPFAAALLTGLLTQSGWVLRDAYKKQFDKLLAVMGEKVIVAWDNTLKTTRLSDVSCSCQRMWVTSLKDSFDRGYFLRKPNI